MGTAALRPVNAVQRLEGAGTAQRYMMERALCDGRTRRCALVRHDFLESSTLDFQCKHLRVLEVRDYVAL